MKASELKRLGLSTNESKIYLALLELGEAQAGEQCCHNTVIKTESFI